MKLKPSMKRKFVLRRTFAAMFIFLLSIFMMGQLFIDKERINTMENLLTMQNQKKIDDELIKKKQMEIKSLYDNLNVVKTDFKWRNKDEIEMGNKPKKLILHHSAISEMTVEDVHEKHIDNGWSGIGYHYFVRKDGTIYQGREENMIGAHVKDNNIDTLGICLEGNFETEMPTEVQYENTLKLLHYLIKKYDINEIEGHREHNDTLCPGDNLKVSEIANDLGIIE